MLKLRSLVIFCLVILTMLVSAEEIVGDDDLKYDDTVFKLIQFNDEKGLIILLAGDNEALKQRDEELGNTPLHYAVNYGNTVLTKFLIYKGADVNVTNNRNQTPLHYAAGRGNKEIVAYLLKNGAKKDICDESGLTAADYASMFHYDAIFTMLGGKTPSQTIRYTSQARRIWLDSLDTRFVTSGNTPKINRSVNGSRFSLGGHSYSRGIGTSTTSQIIIETDSNMSKFNAIVGVDDVCITNDDGTIVTVIGNGRQLWKSSAIKTGKSVSIDLDISDINILELRAVNADNNSLANDVDWVNAFLTPKINNREGVRIVSRRFPLPLQYGKDFFIACSYGDMPRIRQMLQTDPKLISVVDPVYQASPLLWSLRVNMPSVTAYLLQQKADPNLQSLNGYTALHIAAAAGLYKQVEELLKAKADPLIKDKKGYIPRQYAERYDYMKVAKLLPAGDEPKNPTKDSFVTHPIDNDSTILPLPPKLPENKWSSMPEKIRQEAIVRVAKEQLERKNALRYKMGGREFEGFLDCSGFVRSVLREALGMNGLGNTKFMMTSSLFVTKTFDEKLPGDLLVRVDKISTRKYEGHVMIYIGGNQVIDMSSTFNRIAQHTCKESYLREYTVRRVK